MNHDLDLVSSASDLALALELLALLIVLRFTNSFVIIAENLLVKY